MVPVPSKALSFPKVIKGSLRFPQIFSVARDDWFFHVRCRSAGPLLSLGQKSYESGGWSLKLDKDNLRIVDHALPACYLYRLI